MPFNKISGGSNIPPMLPIALSGGEFFMLPAGQGQVGQFGSIASPQLGSNNPLTGQYALQLGQYSVLQQYDQGLNYWQDICVSPYSAPCTISSDGTNYRVANTTGCPVGALITAAGSAGTNGFYGYAQGPGDAVQPALSIGAAITIQNGLVTAGNSIFTITPSAGGSLWNAIVGGAVNTTISFSGTVYNGNLGVNNTFGATTGGVTSSAGSNYTRPPIIVFTPPPNQGQQPYALPTAVCTISGGAINAITVTNQGAGLLGLPGIVVIPQPGDSTGGGAILGWIAANNAQVGSGTVTQMWPAYYGVAVTAVPTFTYGGTSNPAPTVTAIMNFTVTGFTQGTAGVGYIAAGGAFSGGIVSGTPVLTNPMYDKSLSIPIFPPFTVAATTGLPTLTAAGTQFQGVNIQAVPTFSAFSTGAAPSTAAVTTVTVGGANDVVKFMSF